MGVLLHYLNMSRATRVVWLLEELQVPYDVKTYFRNPVTILAPPELAKVHPSGASPLIEDDGVVYAESGNILEHLVSKYGKNSPLIWQNAKEEADIKYALYAAESNIAISGFMIGIHHKAIDKVPWGLKTVIGKLLSTIDSYYALPQWQKTLRNLQTQIENNGGWYTGGRLTVADIMYEVTLQNFLQFGLLKDLETAYPGLYAWHQRILKEPGYIKAQEKQIEFEKDAPRPKL